MDLTHKISSDSLDISTINTILINNKKIELSESAIKKIKDCRAYLNSTMASHDQPIYGINTGFGSLYNVKISKENLTQLQENLVMSHACGVGDQVPKEIVKLMLLLKIQAMNKTATILILKQSQLHGDINAFSESQVLVGNVCQFC